MPKSPVAPPSSPCRTRRPAGSLPALLLLLLVAAISLGLMRPAEAASKFASILIDVGSGRVLQQANADLPRYPASLTKMMTLYMAFQALDDGRLTLDQPLWVSAHAAEQAPTKLGLRPGQTIAAEDAMLALITKSANDAAAVIAENLAGTEYTFAARMTEKANALGMSQTTFRNASGLPDPYQISTARDMSTLALALIHHYPHYYHYFSTKYFYYNGRAYSNHNHMLGVYDGVDGIKTGFTRASGYNLVASAQRDGRRLIGVVLGAPSSMVRNTIMGDLLDQAFAGASEVQVAGLDSYLAGGDQYAAGSLRGDIAGAREGVAYAAAATALAPRRSGSRSGAADRRSRAAAYADAEDADDDRPACRGSKKQRAACVAKRQRDDRIALAQARSRAQRTNASRAVAARDRRGGSAATASQAAKGRAVPVATRTATAKASARPVATRTVTAKASAGKASAGKAVAAKRAAPVRTAASPARAGTAKAKPAVAGKPTKPAVAGKPTKAASKADQTRLARR